MLRAEDRLHRLLLRLALCDHPADLAPTGKPLLRATTGLDVLPCDAGELIECLVFLLLAQVGDGRLELGELPVRARFDVVLVLRLQIVPIGILLLLAEQREYLGIKVEPVGSFPSIALCFRHDGGHLRCGSVPSQGASRQPEDPSQLASMLRRPFL